VVNLREAYGEMVIEFKDRNYDWVFKIYMHPHEYQKTHKGLTLEQAKDKAWGYINEGLMENIGSKIVCGDNITLVEIRKVK
jgi:hypothetical protein